MRRRRRRRDVGASSTGVGRWGALGWSRWRRRCRRRRPRVWGRAVVAVVVALAAVCVMVPAAQAQPQIALQGSNGNLWISDPWTGVKDLTAGMAPGTSPSINNWGEIAFQANTGTLQTNKTGDLRLGMMPGTSPSIDDDCCALTGKGGQIVFQANTGDLWQVAGESNNNSWNLGMMAGTSPSIGHETANTGTLDNYVAFQPNTSDLWNLTFPTDTGGVMAAGTSPSINDSGNVAFQGSNGSLWLQTRDDEGHAKVQDQNAGMAAGTSPSTGLRTSPSINDYGVIAFHANNGHLWVTSDNPSDTGQIMAPYTSPSIDAYGNVAFQGSNGNLWIWDGSGGGPTDTGVAMKAGTSPSIQPGLKFAAPPPPTSVTRGGPENDRLNGGSGHNLIRGGHGNDLIRGRAGKDRSYGGPGNDRSYGGRGNDLLYGGRGNDRIYGGPGKDRIVDHRGATTAFAGSGNNLIDVDDGRGDDRVVCAPGTITDFFADPRDRIARSCLERLAGRYEIPGRVRSGWSTLPRRLASK
jgi:Ca2+-binding RTX toxin-like protein